MGPTSLPSYNCIFKDALLRVLCSVTLHSGDLVPLGVAGRPVADVEQSGQNHPEPLPACQPEAGRVEEYIDQGRKGEEDEAEQWPDERAKCCIDEDRPDDPDDEQSEPREEPREYGE